MRDGASDIVLVEPMIVGDTLAETGQGMVHGIGEYAAAGWGSHGNNLSVGKILNAGNIFVMVLRAMLVFD
jgi:hypothetical protein